MTDGDHGGGFRGPGAGRSATLPSEVGSRGKVLIVDDDPDAGELTRRRLRNLAATIEFHQGPFGTMSAIRAGDYDVVLLDVNMPALTGPQILELLRNEELGSKILLFSSSDEDELALLALNSGAAGYVTKSAPKSELLAKVSELLPAMAPPA